jgi:phage tail sheath gpL-like
MITFNTVPSSIRVPGYYAEFDGSKALSGLPNVPLKILVIGQKLASGTIAALTPRRIVRGSDAIGYFGRGSMLAHGLAALRLANDKTDVDAIALDDAAAATAATGSITVGGAATSAGTIKLMISGRSLAIGVAAADNPAAIAIKIAASVNGDLDGLVTAAILGPVVTLTARNKGTFGNDIDVSYNHYQDESLPAGVTLAITAMTGGATNPDVATIWAAIGDERYDFIILPDASAATLTSAELEMERRAGPSAAIDGLACAGYRGSFTQSVNFGETRNGKFVSLLPAAAMPAHPFAAACAYYAATAYLAGIDPALPFHDLVVPGVIPPKVNDRFTQNERELLLRAGMSTFTVDEGGRMLVERPITAYQVNADNIDDPSWIDLNVPLMLAYCRRTWRARFAKFARYKLADDGALFGPGQNVMTPSVARSENAAIHLDLERAGITEDTQGFKAEQIVERDTTDRSRLNQLLPIRLIGQFRVLAAKFEYRL